MLHHPIKKQQVATISAEQLKQKIDLNSDITLVNLLHEQVYVDCQIIGSISIPFARLLETVASWEKDKEIVVYCAQDNCNQADDAYEMMKDLGFLHVNIYHGGMKEWFKKRFDTTGTCTAKYLHE